MRSHRDGEITLSVFRDTRYRPWVDLVRYRDGIVLCVRSWRLELTWRRR